MNRKLYDIAKSWEIIEEEGGIPFVSDLTTLGDLEKFALNVIDLCVQAIEEHRPSGDFSERSMGMKKARDAIRSYWGA